MPNWAYSQYHCVGDKEQLLELHSTMSELEGMKSPGLHENGFGSTWLGNLVIKLGGDWEKVYCRGTWDNLLLHDDGTVSFSVESAWDEPDEVRYFIESVFPEIRIYFVCEESGMGIYKTNDDTRLYFPEQFYLWVEDETTEYCNDMESLIREVEKITGSKNLKTLDSCDKALKTYSRKNHDLAYSIEEFSVVDD